MPLDERTRRLMLRKLERDHLPRLPVDHSIDFTLPVGIPGSEGKEAPSTTPVDSTDRPAVHTDRDALNRRLRDKLKGRTVDSSEREPPPPSSTLQVGDPVARRVRRLKRGKGSDGNTS